MELRRLIVNADDFGASPGINRGIVEAHVRGIVTSTSLMTERPAAEAAAALAAQHPGLAVGLHFESPEPAPIGAEDWAAELQRQHERFTGLVGREPTHLDSHHHSHRASPLREAMAELGRRLGAPVRELSPIAYLGGFYAQWEWEVTELHHVSVEFLQKILREELTAPWTELGCHPGYVDPGFRSVYLQEREAELATLTDPRVRDTLDQLGVQLCSFADFPGG